MSAGTKRMTKAKKGLDQTNKRIATKYVLQLVSSKRSDEATMGFSAGWYD